MRLIFYYINIKYYTPRVTPPNPPHKIISTRNICFIKYHIKIGYARNFIRLTNFVSPSCVCYSGVVALNIKLLVHVPLPELNIQINNTKERGKPSYIFSILYIFSNHLMGLVKGLILQFLTIQ